MTSPINSITNRINLICIAACVVVGVSLSVLFGWYFDIKTLKSLLPDFPEMNPNTAAGFVLTAVGLLCVAKGQGNRYWKTASAICGGLICLLGAITLGIYITGAHSGIETLFAPSSGIVPENELSGRRSPLAAFNFTAIGLSIVMIGGRQFFGKISELLAFLVLTTTYGSLLGHLYKTDLLIRSSDYNTMALHTMGLFFVCGLSLLAANFDSITVKLLTSGGLGGRMAYKLLPTVILIPTVFGWVRLWGQNQGYYDTAFGASLIIFSCVTTICGVVLFFCFAIEKTDQRRKMAESETAEKERLYRDLFDYGQGMICIHDTDGKITSVNPATFLSLGYESESMIGKNLAEFLPLENQPQFAAYLRKIQNEGLADGYLTLVSNDGKNVIWRYHNILVSEPDAEPYVLGHAQDVTALLKAQKQLKNLSLTDELTGLYNRRGFLTLAEQQIRLERHEGTARGLSLMFADMDGLKKINDIHGHEIGSEAIIELSKIFSSVLRSSDLIARWGGDEFVILTIGTQDEDTGLMTDRISGALDEYNAKGEKPYKLACSIGLAPVPLAGNRSFESIIAEADEAMYAEKRRRKAARIDVKESPFVPPVSTLSVLDSPRQSPRA